MTILDEFELWLDQHYSKLVEEFRNGDSTSGIKALATMDVRIKLAKLIESALEIEASGSLAGVAENNHREKLDLHVEGKPLPESSTRS